MPENRAPTAARSMRRKILDLIEILALMLHPSFLTGTSRTATTASRNVISPRTGTLPI